MRVLVAGGGTAGHVFPAIAVARRLADAHGAEVRFAGTAVGQEATLVPAAGFPFEVVEAKPLRRRVSVDTFTAPVTAVRSVSACRPLVESVDVVLGMGGYVSVPVGLAAARAKRPLVLHEQNAVPGLANRVLARRARIVALTFGEASARMPVSTKVVVTGNPVRSEILPVRDRRDALAEEARQVFELERERRTLVVFGGSQGALHLDAAAVEALRHLRDRSDLQVVLLTGPAHAGAMRTALGETGSLLVRVLGFLERMELAYALADLVVCRAGATTCAEISVCGLASLLVPYPHATANHQEANARALEAAGAAEVVLDAELTAEGLALRVSDLLGDPDRRRSMSERAVAWSRPDAAEAVASVVLQAGGGA